MRLQTGDLFPNFTFHTAYEPDLNTAEVVKEAKKTVFWVLRYIGCTVCRLDVEMIARAYPKFEEKGAQVLVVMQSDAEHIKKDLQDHPIPFRIICDDQMEIYKRLEIAAAKDMEELCGDTEALSKKAEAAEKEGFSHGDYEGDELQLPAMFIVDPDSKVLYARYGKHITDLPTVADLLELL